jgi:uncharacterized repeat protein (TIGR01451 family)
MEKQEGLVNEHRFGRTLGLWACLSLAAACDAPGPELPWAGQGAGLFGKDGPLTVMTPGTVVNRYASLNADARVGDDRLRVRAAAPLMPLTKGDLLLIIQVQGASIDTSDTPNFGAIRELGNAGRYELVTVDSVMPGELGDTITLDGACKLRNAYTASGVVQVVRVPQLESLRVATGASITAPAFNGTVGGVVAVHVRESAQIDGQIDVTGRGFRGGQPDNVSLDPGRNTLIYRSNDPAAGGEKGESIAGGAEVYARLGARYGRGAPANGGGGGSSHNASGGGGANGDNGKAWSGFGVMDGSVTGAAAWMLDPAYRTSGNQLTDSSGGGRGGYSYSTSMAANNPDPLVAGPGDARWGGDRRREAGGLGGRPLQSDPAGRLFLGGGGGAGDGNNGAANAGGGGGGLVLLFAGSVGGGGQIRADGAAGLPTRMGFDDGSSGGGGGGSVVVLARQVQGVIVSANGGKGGDQLNGPVLQTDREAEGPGGGGGGGYIALPAGTNNVATSAQGGAGGTTASPFVSRFPSNGATRGAVGQARAVVTMNVPLCGIAPEPGPDMNTGPDGGSGKGSDLAVKITAAPNPTKGGDPVTYTVSVENRGPDSASGVRVTVNLPPGTQVESAGGPGWTCKTEDSTVICVRDKLEPGKAPDIVIRTRPADAGPSITTGAEVAATTPDPDLSNNKDTTTVGRLGVSYAGGGVTCSAAPGRAGTAFAGFSSLLLLGVAGLLLRRRR